MNNSAHTTFTPPTLVTFLGLGSMSGAIMLGLRRATGPELAVRATTRSVASALKHPVDAGLSVTALEMDAGANTAAVRDAQLVVLGVKPWQITELLQEIAPHLAPGAVVVSVAAGIELAAMREALGDRDDVQLVRAMPNTPALIGRGVTGLAAEPGGDPAALESAEWLFRAVGHTVVIGEQQMAALGAVSGSGPAYLFWFVEQFTAAAQRLGFDAQTAELLAQQTVCGAAALLDAGELSAAEQRVAVTSPNGTTEQALNSFNASGMPEIFDRALGAAIRRTAEIAAAQK